MLIGFSTSILFKDNSHKTNAVFFQRLGHGHYIYYFMHSKFSLRHHIGDVGSPEMLRFSATGLHFFGSFISSN
jgi:hypothetical protein